MPLSGVPYSELRLDRLLNVAAADNAAGVNYWAGVARTQSARLIGGSKPLRHASRVTLAPWTTDLILEPTQDFASQGVATGLSGIFGAVVQSSDIWHATYPKTTLSAPVVRGERIIPVADASLFQANRTMLFWEDAIWGGPGGGSALAKKSEVKQIQSVDLDADIVTLREPLECDYTTACTVRQYADEVCRLDNIIIIGRGQTSFNGIATVNFSRVSFGYVEVVDAPLAGFRNYGAARLQGQRVHVERADQAGQGYGLANSGCHNINVGQVHAEHCRHALTHGGGASFIHMSRHHNYGLVTGIGCMDAIADWHPGCVDVTIGTISGTCNPQGALDGQAQSGNPGSADAVQFQGSGFSCDKIDVTGFRGSGLRGQFYADGDGVARAFRVGHLKAHQNKGPDWTPDAEGDGLGYGFLWDDSGMVPGNPSSRVSLIHIGSLDIEADRGLRINATAAQIDRVFIGAGPIVTRDDRYDAVRIDAETDGVETGAINRVELRGTDIDCAAQEAAAYGVYLIGHAGAPMKALLDNVHVNGGNNSIRATHADVTLTPTTTLTGAFSDDVLLGTGGTVGQQAPPVTALS